MNERPFTNCSVCCFSLRGTQGRPGFTEIQDIRYLLIKQLKNLYCFDLKAVFKAVIDVDSVGYYFFLNYLCFNFKLILFLLHGFQIQLTTGGTFCLVIAFFNHLIESLACFVSNQLQQQGIKAISKSN